MTPTDHTQPSLSPTGAWLLLALGAIGLSALFAVLLVLSRTPYLQQLFGLESLFHTALVLHVNFAVLIWLLSGLGCLWALEREGYLPLLQRYAVGLAAAGALLLSLSPLFNQPTPVMSNYIPALQSPLFFAALLCFGGGMALAALRLLLPGELRAGLAAQVSATAFLSALAVFLITAQRLPQPLDPARFEQLFWGGGHMLQFVYLLLLQQILLRLGGSECNRPLWFMALLPTLAGVVFSLLFDPLTAQYRTLFTELMRYGAPVACLPLIGILLKRPLLPGAAHAALALLGLGMLLGLSIRADNVTVTAHYHATNAAITLALMVMLYQLSPALSLGRVPPLVRRIQLALYGGGMLLYITGMAWSGWLDVPRKTPVLHQQGAELLSMGLMGVGGLIAITATLLFFLLHLRSINQHQEAATTTLLTEGPR